MKIYDCSNSLERPRHRSESYGPPENDVMRYLKENAHKYEAEWVRTPRDADVVMTNDVFPKDILTLGKPMVKRMDGVFWRPKEIARNIPLNRAARQADRVVFISEYSAKCYLELYGPDINYKVVLNWVDPGVFKPIPIPDSICTSDPFYYRREYDEIDECCYGAPRHYSFAACASNWERREKRLTSLLKLARQSSDLFLLIGHVETPLPPNIESVGYLSPPEIARWLNLADAFINLSYKDPAPKVVAQAISCGKPVLYADSGGTRELVGENGVAIPDEDVIEISHRIPPIHPETIFDFIPSIYRGYHPNNPDFFTLPEVSDTSHKFTEMLDGYYEVLRSVI
jgi:glycosyltransferase involved in cell wall biosynthesis